MQVILGPAGRLPCLIIASGSDECVPVTTDIAGQAARLGAAAGALSRVVVLPGGVHNLAGQEPELVEAVLGFLREVAG